MKTKTLSYSQIVEQALAKKSGSTQVTGSKSSSSNQKSPQIKTSQEKRNTPVIQKSQRGR